MPSPPARLQLLKVLLREQRVVAGLPAHSLEARSSHLQTRSPWPGGEGQAWLLAERLEMGAWGLLLQVRDGSPGVFP